MVRTVLFLTGVISECESLRLFEKKACCGQDEKESATATSVAVRMGDVSVAAGTQCTTTDDCGSLHCQSTSDGTELTTSVASAFLEIGITRTTDSVPPSGTCQATVKDDTCSGDGTTHGQCDGFLICMVQADGSSGPYTTIADTSSSGSNGNSAYSGQCKLPAVNDACSGSGAGTDSNEQTLPKCSGEGLKCIKDDTGEVISESDDSIGHCKLPSPITQEVIESSKDVNPHNWNGDGDAGATNHYGDMQDPKVDFVGSDQWAGYDDTKAGHHWNPVAHKMPLGRLYPIDARFDLTAAFNTEKNHNWEYYINKFPAVVFILAVVLRFGPGRIPRWDQEADDTLEQKLELQKRCPQFTGDILFGMIAPYCCFFCCCWDTLPSFCTCNLATGTIYLRQATPKSDCAKSLASVCTMLIGGMLCNVAGEKNDDTFTKAFRDRETNHFHTSQQIKDANTKDKPLMAATTAVYGTAQCLKDRYSLASGIGAFCIGLSIGFQAIISTVWFAWSKKLMSWMTYGTFGSDYKDDPSQKFVALIHFADHIDLPPGLTWKSGTQYYVPDDDIAGTESQFSHAMNKEEQFWTPTGYTGDLGKRG